MAAGCKKTVAEGVAYMYHSYVSAYHGDSVMANSRSIGNFGKGTARPLQVLVKVNLRNLPHDLINRVQAAPCSGTMQALIWPGSMQRKV